MYILVCRYMYICILVFLSIGAHRLIRELGPPGSSGSWACRLWISLCIMGEFIRLFGTFDILHVDISQLGSKKSRAQQQRKAKPRVSQNGCGVRPHCCADQDLSPFESPCPSLSLFVMCCLIHVCAHHVTKQNSVWLHSYTFNCQAALDASPHLSV